MTVIKSLVCVYVTYKVMCKWKRKEFFLTAVPLAILISYFFALIALVRRLKFGDEDYTQEQEKLMLCYQFFFNTGHWIFVMQYIQTSYILPYMLEDARVSIEFDEFEDDHLGGAQLVQTSVQRFKTEYKERVADIRRSMKQVSLRITIVEWVFIAFLFIKTVLFLFLEDHYSTNLFISIYFDNFVLGVVFLFALCRINQLAKRSEINVNTKFMLIHFVCITLLAVSWIGDSLLYFLVDDLWGKKWTDLSVC